LAHSVENFAEDADDVFFSRVLHNENHVLHPLLLKRNDRGYELRRRRHERGLFLRPTMTNAISYTDSYINIGHSYTNFTTSQLSLFNCNLSIYNTR